MLETAFWFAVPVYASTVGLRVKPREVAEPVAVSRSGVPALVTASTAFDLREVLLTGRIIVAWLVTKLGPL